MVHAGNDPGERGGGEGKAGRDKSEASAMALPLQIALKTGPECHQSALAQVAACLLELRHSC